MILGIMLIAMEKGRVNCSAQRTALRGFEQHLIDVFPDGWWLGCLATVGMLQGVHGRASSEIMSSSCMYERLHKRAS